MANRSNLGGIVHTYQRYDPKRFPSPTQPPPDLVSGAMEHMLAYGDYRELTEEELARAVRLDPSQIQGLGPSIDALIAMLEERKRKILERYETKKAQKKAGKAFREAAAKADPPKHLRDSFGKAVRQEQLRDLERLWYRAGDDQSPFARQLVQLIGSLGDKYEVDELAAKYTFTGRESMTVPQAIEIKEELEKIDELLEQLREAAKNAQIGLIDMEALAEFAEPGDVQNLSALQQQVQDYLREMAEQQGLQQSADGYQLTPKAQRLFQGKLLEKLFSELTASRTGRHQGPIVGEGSVEMQRTRAYEYGDSVANLDITGSLTNAILREGPGLPIRLKQDDLEVHYTRNTPKAATCVIMDMSGSMRYDGQYINVKRMALALDGLIRSEYPGDFLQFIEMYSFAKPRRLGEVVKLMPKPVTIHDPWVRLRADMSDPDISESMVPPHFTNIQHSLATARRFLAAQDTPNRQIVLITDGLPTAHFEGSELLLLYPPDPQTEQATMREGQLCKQEGITINMFLVPSWSQSEEDIRFAYRLAESTTGRVFFTAGRDLDRYVVWDYVKRRRDIVS
ncbi:hypothetical protein KOR34_37910 [Posidoniimonas corsicana]|uniref:VWFA domain-containing protein n=1 Tax=Posidoniimonas corsicana TaxID=1938618 RepID=A0A5C5V882_9BACT|nr:hypothetical protein [Posidoniimonas corsicana]TWT33955.1 hypothetical protein KOR34_37910 [Posidoniimonas corsicana]